MSLNLILNVLIWVIVDLTINISFISRAYFHFKKCHKIITDWTFYYILHKRVYNL